MGTSSYTKFYAWINCSKIWQAPYYAHIKYLLNILTSFVLEKLNACACKCLKMLSQI